jgi:hypothetical protein
MANLICLFDINVVFSYSLNVSSNTTFIPIFSTIIMAFILRGPRFEFGSRPQESHNRHSIYLST